MSNSVLVVKRLMRSDLGWFAAAFQAGVTKGKQKGINIDKKVIMQIANTDELEKGCIWVNLTYRLPSGAVIRETASRPLRHQGKNWRLTGPQIKEIDFKDLKPGDYLLCLFSRSAGPMTLLCEVITHRERKATKRALFSLLSGFSGASIPPTGEHQAIMKLWCTASPELFVRLGNEQPVKHADLREQMQHPHILEHMASVSLSLSSTAQADFVENLSLLVSLFRDFVADDICSVSVDQGKLWRSVKGNRIGFIDGGVASVESLGSEPLAIRVGCYTVIPGHRGADRETFDFAPQLVDELFNPTDSDDGTFEEFDENTSKLRDIARITLETAGALRALRDYSDLKFLFLHGPLVNPVAPYADMPVFRDSALTRMGITSSDVLSGVSGLPRLPAAERHFIAVYRYLLDQIWPTGIPLVGVIERSGSSTAVAQEILLREESKGAVRSQTTEALKIMKDYRITDSLLFSLLLKEGEYLRPIQINKNARRKAPEQWKSVIERYPQPWSTYVRPTSDSMPFRVEMNVGDTADQEAVISLVVHMARLLPRYAFPVGLHIVDQFAKVPAWMSRQISRQQASQLVHKAMATRDPSIIAATKLFLSGNKRDWLLRPRFDA